MSPQTRSVFAAVADAIAERPQRLLALLCAWHLLFWVLGPALGYRMLPLDTLELLGWGQAWELGYYKHPPLGAWLGEGFLQLAGGRLDSLYLLAQLGVVVTFVYVYRTGLLFLDPLRAALAVALLEGSYFHTYLTPNFNMNSLQLPLWAGASYHFLRGLRDGANVHWLAFGLFAALSLLSKYSGLLLLASCGALLLLTPTGRQRLRQPGPWLAAASCLLLISPHLLWLAEHWQLPWSYLRGFGKAGSGGVAAHLIEPLRFALGALAGLLFSGALWLGLRGGRPARPSAGVLELALLLLLFGPLLLSVCYGVVSGSRLKSTWAFPFFSLAGVWAMRFIDSEGARQRLPRFLAMLALILLLTSSLHWLYKTHWGDSKTRFDGQALAQTAQSTWQARHALALRIVIADHIDSAIIAAYAPSRPDMLIEGDFGISPWLTPEDVAQRGALWVCREGRRCPDDWRPRLDGLQTEMIDGVRFQIGWISPRDKPAGETTQ